MRTWVHLLAIIFLQAASLIKEKCDSPHLVQGVLGRRLQPRGWIWERQNKRASHARHPHQSRGSRAPSLGRFLACLQEARHAEIKRNLFCGRKGRFFWPGIPILGRRQEAYCIKGKLIKYFSAGRRGGMSKTCQCSLEKIIVVSYSFPDNSCGVS